MALVNQVSADVKEAFELNRAKRLYLKPIARMAIKVTLPELKLPGLTVSNWEVMEKLKSTVAPDLFTIIKVTKSSFEHIYFEAEADSKSLLNKFIEKLNNLTLKLSGFAEPLKVTAAQRKVPFPKKHDWDAFFRDTPDMDECKPGERPDTVHIKGLPSKWFLEKDNSKGDKPNPEVVFKVFEKFAPIRAIDIPALDPYRHRMASQEEGDSDFKKFSFTFGSTLNFEAYIQYMDYTGFARAMKILKGKKLIKVLEDNKAAAANIEVTFDKTAHLSEKQIKTRDCIRKKLVQQDQEEEEKRKREREETEKQKEFEKLEEKRKAKEALRLRIERRKAREEKRKLRRENRKLESRKRKVIAKQIAAKQQIIEVQRHEEATRLVTELLGRIAVKKGEEEEENKKREEELKILRQLEEKKRNIELMKKLEEKKKKKQKSQSKKKEKSLRKKLEKKLEDMKSKKEELQRELLRERVAKSKEKLSSVVTTGSLSLNPIESDSEEEYAPLMRQKFRGRRGYRHYRDTFHGRCYKPYNRYGAVGYDYPDELEPLYDHGQFPGQRYFRGRRPFRGHRGNTDRRYQRRR